MFFTYIKDICSLWKTEIIESTESKRTKFKIARNSTTEITTINIVSPFRFYFPKAGKFLFYPYSFFDALLYFM